MPSEVFDGFSSFWRYFDFIGFGGHFKAFLMGPLKGGLKNVNRDFFSRATSRNFVRPKILEFFGDHNGTLLWSQLHIPTPRLGGGAGGVENVGRPWHLTTEVSLR